MQKFKKGMGKTSVSFSMLLVFSCLSISYIEAQVSSVFPQEVVDNICLENRDKKEVLDTETYTARPSLALMPFQSGNDQFPELCSGRACSTLLLQSELCHYRFGNYTKLGYELLEKAIARCERDISKSKSFFTHENHFSGGRDFCDISKTRQDLYIGPGPDTFLIATNYVQDGNIFIFGQGVLLVDNAELTLSGHLYAQNQGQALFRNGAYLHVDQLYLSQYPQIFHDSARFEATDATVYANTVYRTLLYDNSEYVAKRTYFPYWNFRQLYDNSRLIMEDANMVGDLTINDSCQVSFLRCDTILPWFGIGEGDYVDIQFPDYNYLEHFQFDTTHPGIDGIKYSVSFDTCHFVVCGIESWPGCSITINNSLLCATPRIFGPDTAYFDNITNYTFYPFLSVPLVDRFFQIVNSYVQLWCIYTYDDAVLFMDSCCWGESHAKDSSIICATQCTATGFPSSVTSVDNGFYSFTDGECNTFVSAWDRGTVLLINAYVAPSNPGAAQVTNLAHGQSNLLAVNSYFEYTPEAMDTALVMVTAIDSPSIGMVDTTINIYGSAWIDLGPYNPITFDRYKLYWADDGDTIWILIQESLSQIYDSLIGTWNTSGMSVGVYDLRLTLWDDAGDSLTAFGNITLQVQGMNDELDIKTPVSEIILFQNYPNPFNQITEISFQIPEGIDSRQKSIVSMKIYDVSGRIVKSFDLVSCFLLPASSVSWCGTDDFGNEVPSAVYFCRMQVGDNFSETKKMLLLR